MKVKYCKETRDPIHVYFEIEGIPIRVAPIYYRGVCEWWNPNNVNIKYECDLAYPVYPIVSEEEDMLFVFAFYDIMGKEDLFAYVKFVKNINKAVRKFLPPNHFVWGEEITPMLKKRLGQIRKRGY